MNYDAIIIGARAAGATTAMLLARRGKRVLVLDRARYGSDTLSTHALMRPALIQLERWGLLERVIASGAPAIRRAIFHYPFESVSLDIEPLYAPRRTVLDAILADAAKEAGAEVRYSVFVDELLHDGSGRVIGIHGKDSEGGRVREHAPLVIGADGIRSLVAAHTGAAVTRCGTASGAIVFAYFRGVEAEGYDYEWIYGNGIAAGIIPTHGGEACVFVSGSPERFHDDVVPDMERGFARLLIEASSGVAARVLTGERTSRFRYFAGLPGYARKPFGPGWALVGDAGYFRDPITTHGITDAFRDAELLARAVDGTSTFEEYEATRDAVTAAHFDVTERIAGYDWGLNEIRQHLRDVSRAMKPEAELLLGLDQKEAVA